MIHPILGQKLQVTTEKGLQKTNFLPFDSLGSYTTIREVSGGTTFVDGKNWFGFVVASPMALLSPKEPVVYYFYHHRINYNNNNNKAFNPK
jgi:hypothetical protein